jgi:hypothetical protein
LTRANSVRALEALCNITAGSRKVRDAINSVLLADSEMEQRRQERRQRLDVERVVGWDPLCVDAAGNSWYWLDAPQPNNAAKTLVTSRLYWYEEWCNVFSCCCCCSPSFYRFSLIHASSFHFNDTNQGSAPD